MRRVVFSLLLLGAVAFAGPDDARAKLRTGLKKRDAAALRAALAADTDGTAFRRLRPLDYAALSRHVEDSEAARAIVKRSTAAPRAVQLPAVRQWTAARIEQAAKEMKASPALALSAALQSPDAKLRAAAAMRLVELGDERARAAVAAALERERDPGALRALQLAARKLGLRGEKPGALYLDLARRTLAGELPPAAGDVVFTWGRSLQAGAVPPHLHETELARQAVLAAQHWDADPLVAGALLARIDAAQELAVRAVAAAEGGLAAGSRAPVVARLGPPVVARALAEARDADQPELVAWLCGAAGLVRGGQLDPLVPELAHALVSKDPLVRGAAAEAVRSLEVDGSLAGVKVGDEPFALLMDSASGAAGEPAMLVLAAADLTDEQRAAVEGEAEMVPMAGERGEEPRERKPTEVTVFYGTDRARFRAGAGWYAWRFWPAGAALLFALLAPSLLRWLMREKFAWVARVAFWSGVVAAAVFVVRGAYEGMRMHEKLARLGVDYGPERGPFDGMDGPYCYFGTAVVGIPPDHELGQIERPSLLSGRPWEDPEHHVMILTVEPKEKERFFGELAERGKREAFVFVHGFNVKFEDAALRTAQIAHDIDFAGAPIFFSWPSRGGLLEYTRDESTVSWATRHLKLFLRDVRAALPDATIHLVAHSMGNRALTEALRRLVKDIEQDGMRRFQEVVLAAPDIDAATFRDDIAPAIRPAADRITLYAAQYDQALEASKKVHGYPRAGDSKTIVVVDGIQSVDVRAKDQSILGHSYYGDVGRVIDDLVRLILYREPPDRRGLVFDDEAGCWRLE